MAKDLIKKLFEFLGFKIARAESFPPGSTGRRFGFETLMEDVKFRGLECKTFLDGGIGSSPVESITIKNVFPNASCVLVEPNTDFKKGIDAFISKNPDAVYIPKGLGARSEKLAFNLTDSPDGSSFVPYGENSVNDTKEVRILEVTTINDLIQQGIMKIPEIIKLDIQGFELEALKGGSLIMGKTELIILELSLFKFNERELPIFHEVVEFMSNNGYLIYEYVGTLRRPFDGASGSIDMAFALKNGVLRKSNKW